jgi:hypothetical protein
MTKRSGSSSHHRSSTLTDREQEIAERVRRALHLSPSMSLEEVAEQFRHSAAWRRERLGLMGEELRDGLWRATRPLLRSLWERVRAGWTWLRGDAATDPPRSEGESDEKQV